jgi:hypothetical protein
MDAIQIAVSPETRARSTLDRIDYADAFRVDASAATAEAWARSVLEGAPASIRASMRSGWTSLGLRLERGGSDPNVLGWRFREREVDHVLLGAGGWLGISGELLFTRDGGFSTFVRFAHPAARALWAAIEPTHVRVVRSVLEDAARRSAVDAGREAA